MPDETTTAEISIASDLDELPRLVAFVADFGRSRHVSARTLMQLNLILEELIVNMIQHGYADSPGRIHVALERREDRLHALLIDRAPAYDPFTAAPPDLTADVEDRNVGGLGVHLVREFADGYSYERQGDQNRVEISMRA